MFSPFDEYAQTLVMQISGRYSLKYIKLVWIQICWTRIILHLNKQGY